MHGQHNDKYNEMHGQQNDKYTEMHGQQKINIMRCTVSTTSKAEGVMNKTLHLRHNRNSKQVIELASTLSKCIVDSVFNKEFCTIIMYNNNNKITLHVP